MQDRIPDQYIVVLRDDVPAAEVPARAADLSRTHGGATGHIYTHALKGFSVRMPEAAARALSRNPHVEYVAEDGEVGLAATQFNPTWGLDRIDQRDRPLNGQYNYGFTGAGVHAYVIDTGIRPTHQDFGGRASIAADFVGDGQGGNDCNGHGTHVAGTLGGTSYGVAKGVTIRAVRVLDCTGNGQFSWVIAGVDWVTANRALPAVANMSLSGGVYEPLDTAVRNSIASGVTYAVAAGNDYGLDASQKSPARVSEALTVAASNVDDLMAGFSNGGPLVDLFAPGVDITSAWIGSDTATNTIPGTSMASPHVAGVAALYLQANPGHTPSTVNSAIVNQATVGRISGIFISGTPNRLLYSLIPMSAPPIRISGRVTNGAGTGLASVNMALSGSQTSSVQTDSSGNYSFSNLTAGGSYTVTPSRPGYTFSPPGRSYASLNASQTEQNFTGTPTASEEIANVALNKAATQSSTYEPALYAGRAADGVTAGTHAAGTVSHTYNNANAWWHVDLGGPHSINSVEVWNRADGSQHTNSNFYVLVSDTPFASTDLNTTLSQPGVSSYFVPGTAGTPTTVAVGRTGRYVRVQLSGTNHLVLSEVEVIGNAQGGP